MFVQINSTTWVNLLTIEGYKIMPDGTFNVLQVGSTTHLVGTGQYFQNFLDKTIQLTKHYC